MKLFKKFDSACKIRYAIDRSFQREEEERKMFYFLEEDFEGLDAEINIILEKIKEIKKRIGESCKDGADTWHDNFGFEDGQREYSMWSKRLQELLYIKANAKVITPDFVNEKVDIGRVVTIQDEIKDKIQTFKIGSYMVFKGQNKISYKAPLAIILINGKVGERRKGVIGGKIKIFKILKIK